MISSVALSRRGRPRKDIVYKQVRLPLRLHAVLTAKATIEQVSAYELFGRLVSEWAEAGITKANCRQLDKYLISYSAGDWATGWLEASVHQLLFDSAFCMRSNHPEILGNRTRCVGASVLAWAIIMREYADEPIVKSLM